MNGRGKPPLPGNHEDKQAARMFLYRYAAAAPIQGHAVTLAGTEPESEVALMRDYLKWPAKRAWFVDNNNIPTVKKALRWIKKDWGDTNVLPVDLSDLAPKLGAIGFANLDFMGAPLQERTVRCLNRVIPRMLPNAIMGFTWIRGREHPNTHSSARLLWEMGIGYQGNNRRWAGVLRAIDIISDGALEFVDRWEYQSNHSPMAVAVFRRVA